MNRYTFANIIKYTVGLPLLIACTVLCIIGELFTHIFVGFFWFICICMLTMINEGYETWLETYTSMYKSMHIAYKMIWTPTTNE